MPTLGYRNNNPGNLVKGSKPFLGEVFPGTDKRFRQFQTMDYGYRAAMKVLVNFISSGYNTIEKIITRWAPPVENNTKAYINSVAIQTGIQPNFVITIDQADYIKKIMAAISRHENGIEPDFRLILKGWELLEQKKS